MHADVILAGKLIRLEKKEIKILMNENIYPPWNSDAINCWVKLRSCEEVLAVTFSFAGGVSSEARELANDEDVAASNLFSNPPVVPDLSVAAREAENCVRRALGEMKRALAVTLTVKQKKPAKSTVSLTS